MNGGLQPGTLSGTEVYAIEKNPARLQPVAEQGWRDATLEVAEEKRVRFSQFFGAWGARVRAEPGFVEVDPAKRRMLASLGLRSA